MAYEFSLAHLSVLQCSPPEMVNIADKTGYQYVSLRIKPLTDHEPTHPLAENRKMMKETKRLLADTGVRVHDIEILHIGPDTDPEAYVSFFEAGGELNARSVICLVTDPDRSRVIECFGRLCELAGPYGLTIDLEFVPWLKIPDLNAATSVIEAVGKPNAGILVDVLHFSRSESSLEDLKNLPREWFHFVHLCDAEKEIPATKEGLIHTARSDRMFPGEGGLNLREILDCIPTVPCSLEVPNEVLIKELGPEEFARRAIRAAEKFFED